MNRRQFIELGLSAGATALFSPSAFAAAKPQDKTLIFGGGAFALGYAVAHPDETLVLERGLHLAADFALTGEPDAPGVPRTDIGRELLAELTKAGLLRENRLVHPPLADFMSVFTEKHGVKTFLNAELANLEKKSDGWRVTICGGGTEGLVSFDVARFADTTDLGWRNAGAEAIRGKRFSAVTDKGIHTVELPSDATWRAARLKLYESADAGLADGAKILAECSAMRSLYREGRIERKINPGYIWIPSAQFGSLIEAFEEGVKWNSL